MTMSARRVTGIVKWYDSGKGYGFVTIDGEGRDAMLHNSSLRKINATQVFKSAKVECMISDGEKGLQVDNVLSMVEPVPVEDSYIPVTVKWFNAKAGYGFVTRGEGTPDIFIHAEVVRSCNLIGLDEGQRVFVIAESSAKGQKVVHVKTVSQMVPAPVAGGSGSPA